MSTEINDESGSSRLSQKKNIDISNCGFPERLQRYREAKKLAPWELAQQAGVHTRTVTDIERGRRKNIVPSTLMGFAQALDRSVDDLLGRDPAQFENPTPVDEPPPRPSRFPWGLMLKILAALLLISAILIFQRFRTAPFDITDSRLHVQALGIMKWESPMDIKVSQAAEAPWSRFWGHPIVFTREQDSPGDGILSVVERISGQPIWEDHISQEELAHVFGDWITGFGDMFCKEFRFAKLREDGGPVLLSVYRHKDYYPACFRVLDAHGRALGTYFHPGFPNSILVTDLDEDGAEEFLITGTNNPHTGATLILLDAEHCNGAAIDEVSSSAFARSFPDSARCRFILPGFSPNKMAQLGLKRFHAHDPRIFQSTTGETRIRVLIGSPLETKDAYQLILDQDLRPIELYASDRFQSVVAIQLKEGKLDFDPTTKEFLEAWLARAVRYEAGHKY